MREDKDKKGNEKEDSAIKSQSSKQTEKNEEITKKIISDNEDEDGEE